MGIPGQVDFAHLFDPKSVVVIGASADENKWGYQYAYSLLKSRDKRSVYLVNPRSTDILGERAFPDVDALPEIPELAVICVPSSFVADAIEEAVNLGVKSFVCITAGFAETGSEGLSEQKKILNVLHAGGARMVGPNCLGIYDGAASFQCIGFWDVMPGEVGLISQSGTVLLELSARLAKHGAGLSRAVSVGNQADLGARELLPAFANSTQTRVMVAYIEDFLDPRLVIGEMQALKEAGKECVLLCPGGNDSVRRAAASHTGSLVAEDELVEAACADAGIVRVRSISAALRAIHGMLAPTPYLGSRVAVVADGGGAAVLGSDACVKEGLEVPAFSSELRTEVVERLGSGSGTANPIDAVGALSLGDLLPAVEVVFKAPEIDTVFLTGALNNVKAEVGEDEHTNAAKAILDAAKTNKKGLMVSSMYADDPAVRAFSDLGVPVFTGAAEAAESMRLALRRPGRRKIPQLPPIADRMLPSFDYFGARQLFAGYDIPLSPVHEVHDRDSALKAAKRVGYPVVLKAMGLLHKSDSGGVALDISSESELLAAIDDMIYRLNPPSFSLEAMAKSGSVDLLLGSVRKAGFGPTVTVAAGGVHTEILRDTVTALAPVDAGYAEQMLRRLRIAPLLDGYRGAPPVDVPALAAIVARFSKVLVDNAGISEAEINPLRAGVSGLLALDARILAVDT